MIVYRPIAPLTLGSSGLMSTLAAMVSTAVIGTPSWQNSGDPSEGAVPEGTGNTAVAAEAVPTGKRRPERA